MALLITKQLISVFVKMTTIMAPPSFLTLFLPSSLCVSKIRMIVCEMRLHMLVLPHLINRPNLSPLRAHEL